MKRKKKRSKELKVGVFIAIALAIIVGTVFSIGGQKKLFGGKAKYKIHFNSTGGLYEGDPVLLTGVEIGNVARLGFPKDVGEKKILVEIAVLREVCPRIRKDTRARVASASLVYGKVVELTMGSLEEPVIPEGGIIQAEEVTSYDAIVGSTNLMVEDIRRLLSKIEQGQGTVGMLLNEPLETRETLHNLSIASQRLAQLLERADQGRGPLGTLFSDSVEIRQTLKGMQKTVRDLETTAENLKGKQSVAGKLINDPEYGEALMQDLHSAIHSLASVAAKIDTGKGTLGSLINDKEMYYGLQDVVLGVQKSSLTRWLIQNRRKAGEKERLKREVLTEEKKNE